MTSCETETIFHNHKLDFQRPADLVELAAINIFIWGWKWLSGNAGRPLISLIISLRRGTFFFSLGGLFGVGFFVCLFLFRFCFFFWVDFHAQVAFGSLLNEEASFYATRRPLQLELLVAFCLVLLPLSQYILSMTVRRGGRETKQHYFVRAMVLGGTGSFSSYSFKGSTCEIDELELTFTDSRYEWVIAETETGIRTDCGKPSYVVWLD